MTRKPMSLSKELEKSERNIKRLDKNPLEYKERDWAIFVAGFIFFGGVLTKLLNVEHWFQNGFEMSSYNPYVLIIYVPSSILWIWYAHYRREPVFLAMGVVGFIYTMLLTYGIIKTYFPIDPFV